MDEKTIPPITLKLKLFQKDVSGPKANGIRAHAVVKVVIKIGRNLS